MDRSEDAAPADTTPTPTVETAGAAPPSAPPPSSPSSTATLIGSILAVLLGTIGIVALGVVLANDDDSESAAGAGGGAGGSSMPTVSLTEFAIDPGDVSVAAGGMLHVTNSGSVEHNLAIPDADLRTENLAAGAAGEIQIGDLAPGTYEMLCEIAGPADAGMTGTLTVTEGGDGGGGGSTGGGTPPEEMDYQAMTDAMLDSFAQYPAETEGLGNQLLEPTEVLPDGTKVFDLTRERGDWEVDPGNVVEAWTFNGMVPAPMIRLEIGDRMHLRVRNDLPIATDVHLHGLNVENRFDGVSPITQDLIEPGESFTYEYTADEQAVAMYHPHAHGHMLLPNGMFGGIIVGDVALPRGQTVGLEQIPADLEVSQEIPMVLNDSGVIGYSLNGKSFPATQPYVAATGDWVLIHYFNEGNLIHPMHLHQFDQIVVAKDGYPLDEPYTVDTLNVAPGERYSVLVNLDRPGTWVWHCHILNHVEREEGMFGMVTAVIVEEQSPGGDGGTPGGRLHTPGGTRMLGSVDIPDDTIDDLVKRLRRVEGQVRGIQQMLTEGRDCRDVVTQISAANRALEQAGFMLVAAGLTWCLQHPEESAAEGYDVADVQKMFTKLA